MCAHSEASALFLNTRTLTRRKRLYCEDPNEFYDVRTTKNFVRKMRVSKYRRTQKFKILNKDVLHYGETLFKKLRSRQRPETKASLRQNAQLPLQENPRHWTDVRRDSASSGQERRSGGPARTLLSSKIPEETLPA